MINLSGTSILTYTDAMEQLKKLSNVYFGQDKVNFTAAYPQINNPDDIVTPLITYKLKEKTPGLFGSTKEIKPRYRGEVQAEVHNTVTDENEIITVVLSGQMFDYLIEFEIWEADPIRADKTLEEFERFINQYTGYLMKSGVDKIFFQSATGMNDNGAFETTLSCRKVEYLFRIDTVIGAECKKIDNITIAIRVHEATGQMLLELLNDESYATPSPYDTIIILPDEDSDEV